MKRFIPTLAALLSTALFASIALGQQAPDPKAQAKQFAELVKKGNAPIEAACTSLDNPARYLLEGMARHVTRPGAPAAERDTFESTIIEAVKKTPDPFLIKLLRWSGTGKSAPVLGGLLNDDKTNDYALRALETIGGAAAIKAMRDAKATGRSGDAILLALGRTRDATVVPRLLKAVETAETHEVGLTALALSGDPRGKDFIMGHLALGDRFAGYARAVKFAEALAANKKTDAAAAVCRELIQASDTPELGQVHCNALSLLTELLGTQAEPELMTGLNGKSTYVRARAGELAAAAKVPGLSEKLAKLETDAEDDAVRKDLLHALANVGDALAIDHLISRLSDETIGEVAANALASLPGGTARDALLNALANGNTDAAKPLGFQAKAPELIAAYKKAKNKDNKLGLLKSLDQSGTYGQAAFLLGVAGDTDADLRKSAHGLLKGTAQPGDIPKLFEFLVANDNKTERRRLAGLIISANEFAPDDATRFANLDALYKKAKVVDQREVLNMLSSVQTDSSAKLLDQAHEDADLANAALRVLTKWQNPSALKPLVRIADVTENATNHKLAIGAATRLATTSAQNESVLAVAREDDAIKTLEEKVSVAKIRELKGWKALFDGDLAKTWDGGDRLKRDRNVIKFPGDAGLVATKASYADFVLHFQFRLTPGANNGLGIRVPKGSGNPSKDGMELQILDNNHEKYAKLKPEQFHGSLYSVAAAKRGALKPAKEWNNQYVLCIGQHVKVILNDQIILDTHLDKIESEYPGLKRKDGHIVLCGHGDALDFRNMRIIDYGVPGAMKVPSGFQKLFDGKSLANWRGSIGNPKQVAKMSADQRDAAQEAATKRANKHWKPKSGVLEFDGKGQNLVTAENFADFDLYVDWKIVDHADSGIYLRGLPQVQIWDPANPAQNKHGNKKGSGGLWNNKSNPSAPLVKADKPVGEWNRFFIRMVGDRTSIWLNDKLVVDDTILENYWNRSAPTPSEGPIELQNHGNTLWFREIHVRRLPR